MSIFMSLLWLATAVVTAIIEAATFAMVSIWFTAGAVAALLASMVTDSFFIQLCVFVAVSAVSFLAFRSKVIDKNKRLTPTNADRAIGKEGRVIERIDNKMDTGAVVIDGQEWTARAADDKETFEAGEIIRVKEIKGVKVFVEGNSKRD